MRQCQIIRPVGIKDIGTACPGSPGIAIRTGDDIGLAICIQIPCSQTYTETIVVRGRNDDISGCGGGRDTTVIVEEIGTADIGRIPVRTSSEVSFPVSIEITRSEGIPEIVIRRFASDDNVGGRGGGRDGTVIVKNIDAAGIGGHP
jgi:hypothetical protein